MTAVPLASRKRRPVLLLVALLCLLVLGLAPQASAARFGFFSPTGSMSVPRSGAAAAPLPDGRVLVAGGYYFSPSAPYDHYLSSAEVFDPATNSFSSAGIGSMSVPRIDAVAAPLPDGRVLVAGGTSFDGNLQDMQSAEIFDPATNSFSSTGIGSMSTPRAGAVAAPLPDGRVLVAGGVEEPHPTVISASAEVFDPATNTFSSAGIGSMTRPSVGAAAAPLPDGVLVAGGFERGLGAEVFDPATNTFSSTWIGSMSTPRSGAVAAPLPDGRVLVAGTGGLPPASSSAEIFSEIFAPGDCTGKQLTIAGSTGADRSFASTLGADVIAGLDGNDVIAGLDGNDVICGGKGKDRLYGQYGNDKLSGEQGNDTVEGNSGRDTLKGGAGKDILKGGPGKDVLKGGGGKDILKGGPGKDVLKGGGGKDKQVQ
jgi:Ca2+-binding RTX toxin-like protein